jgi:hypothetical protein
MHQHKFKRKTEKNGFRKCVYSIEVYVLLMGKFLLQTFKHCFSLGVKMYLTVKFVLSLIYYFVRVAEYILNREVFTIELLRTVFVFAYGLGHDHLFGGGGFYHKLRRPSRCLCVLLSQLSNRLTDFHKLLSLTLCHCMPPQMF